MTDQRTCAECGRTVPGNSPGKLCPACLMRAGLKDETLSFHPEGSQNEQTGDSMPVAPVKQLAAGDEFGGYKIVRRLGRGGMGVVYEADQTETGRRVALKVLARSLDNPEARKRFLREGRLAASINHPNSVYVFGTDEVEDVPIISMELVRGGTLAEQVAKNGPFPVARAVDAILQVIDGLEAAREKGVLHRDVKPANCFIEPDGTVKIGDFGLSISTGPRDDISQTELTLAGQVLGTPAFASPEQLRGGELDIRSDIYSVAVTLFYLLTGDTPFRGKNLVQLLATVLEQTAPRVDQLRPDVPKGLANVIARCLHKLPEQRFRDYDSLRQELLPFSTTAPTPALLGLRTLASFVDSSFLYVLSLAISLVVYPVPSGGMREAFSTPFLTALIITQSFTIFYYGLTESIWGASIGKALFQLRVVDQNGSNPRLGRSLARAFVFVVWPVLFTLVYHVFMFVMGFMAAMSLVEDDLRPSMVIVMLLGPINIAMFLLMFSTARRSNGYAGIHDRIGGVTVVSRHAETGRIPWSVEDLPLPQLAALPTIGPFSVLDTLAVEESSELLLAYDTKLLRRVWLCRRSRESAPVPEAIRNLSRPGRLRWLANGVEDATVWDAYEAPRGIALVDALQQQPNWSSIRYWLSDLAEELRIASDEGTLPETVSLDRLWVTSDGRLKILDFAAPAVTVETEEVPSVSAATASSESYIRFIEDVSRFVTAPKKRSQRKQPLLIPLSARSAIEHLAKATSLEVIADRLRALLLDAPAVTRPRRFGLLFCCVAMSLFAGTGLLMQRIVVNVGQIDMAPKPELLELNYAASILSAYRFSPTSLDEEPDLEMLRTWIVGHHRKTVESPEVWDDMKTMSMFFGRRGMIEDLMTRPDPSAEELAEADKVVQPMLDQIEKSTANAYNQTSGGARLGLRMLPGMMAITWLYVVWFPSLFAALIFRGGIFLRLFNIVAVRRDGKRASGLRMFWRALVPAPVGMLLAVIGISQMSGEEFLPDMTVVAAWGVLLLVVVLLVISAWHPQRSISDRLAGTYLVPR